MATRNEPAADTAVAVESAHCDSGWIHECGGTHELVETKVEVVDENGNPVTETQIRPKTPFASGGCSTVRCTEHCSCSAQALEGLHDSECALP